MAKMIHSMIRVLEEERSVTFYTPGFRPRNRRSSRFRDLHADLSQQCGERIRAGTDRQQGREDAYDLGNGYGHLAVSVSDLDSEHQRLTGLRMNPGKIVEFNRDGALLARFFFFITDPDGYKIEVLQRHGRSSDGGAGSKAVLPASLVSSMAGAVAGLPRTTQDAVAHQSHGRRMTWLRYSTRPAACRAGSF